MTLKMSLTMTSSKRMTISSHNKNWTKRVKDGAVISCPISIARARKEISCDAARARREEWRGNKFPPTRFVLRGNYFPIKLEMLRCGCD